MAHSTTAGPRTRDWLTKVPAITATITADLQAMVAGNDLAAAKKNAKDLEVNWDDAEAGLKPRDSGRWHQLDDEIDAVLTSLRAGNPSQADSAANLAALKGTLDQFDGI